MVAVLCLRKGDSSVLEARGAQVRRYEVYQIEAEGRRGAVGRRERQVADKGSYTCQKSLS